MPLPRLPRLIASLLAAFRGSAGYWEDRYRRGGDSGEGSSDRLAAFKAEVLNDLVEREGIASVVEFGCGDGRQLALARYPRYLGLDVSPSALRLCRERFAGDPTRRFALLEEGQREHAELALSIDVVYHLVEDEVFEAHLRALFEAAQRFVVLYTTDSDDFAPRFTGPHVRHRPVRRWIARNIEGWELERVVPNRYPFSEADPDRTSPAEFLVYRRSATSAPGRSPSPGPVLEDGGHGGLPSRVRGG